MTSSIAPGNNDAIQAEFVEVMRNFASTVAVVAALDGEGRPTGLAATTLNSLSMDPPSVMFAVNRSASSFDVFDTGVAISVSVLSVSQQDVLRPFFGGDRRDDRFAAPLWSTAPDGLPLLEESCAAMTARIEGHVDYGSHRVFMARLTSIKRSDAEPLLWYGRTACRPIPHPTT